VLKFRLPHRHASAVPWIYITLYHYHMRVFINVSGTIYVHLQGKDCRYVVHDLQITRCHASENKFQIHWIRFAHLRYKQPLFYCPLCYAFFALTLLASLYQFLIGAVSFSVLPPLYYANPLFLRVISFLFTPV
jgi:hypothetical protein